MKTKLILLTAVLAVFAAQGAASQGPRWEGDKPDSWVNQRLKEGFHPHMLPMELGMLKSMKRSKELSPESIADYKRASAEFDSYYKWYQQQQAAKK